MYLKLTTRPHLRVVSFKKSKKMYGNGEFLPVFMQTSATVAEFTELCLKFAILRDKTLKLGIFIFKFP